MITIIYDFFNTIVSLLSVDIIVFPYIAAVIAVGGAFIIYAIKGR